MFQFETGFYHAMQNSCYILLDLPENVISFRVRCDILNPVSRQAAGWDLKLCELVARTNISTFGLYSRASQIK